jgi:hypothetical protein
MDYQRAGCVMFGWLASWTRQRVTPTCRGGGLLCVRHNTFLMVRSGDPLR